MDEKTLIKGYMFRGITNDLTIMDGWEGMEQVYAVYEDGTILTTGIRKFSTSFNPKGQKWERVGEVHKDAEFIGNYPSPISTVGGVKNGRMV